eukprot:TRINITY_DN40366_c0_g1_i1.p1 TRINITY_DN40366_c0_g1~~TRINITY_DN40366_c0_g1_i1.p1  ORF type:complete len:143 (+),score=38.40 TRINITY_DN40366_c0_g1_i1:336-764(+)
MEEQKVFSLAEVANHTSKDDCWVVIHGKVYDVSKFLEEHPGGEEVLVEASGKDATQEFEDIGHSESARGMMETYEIGTLEGFKGDTTKKETKRAFKEIPASIVKENEPSLLVKLLQFLLPLLIVGVAFGIRIFLKDPQSSSS